MKINDIELIPLTDRHYRVRQEINIKKRNVTLYLLEMREGYKTVILSKIVEKLDYEL